MTKQITQVPICDGVTFHNIGEQRFKTGRLTAAMLLPCPPKPLPLTRYCPTCSGVPSREYPTFRKLNEKLSSLYGASFKRRSISWGGPGAGGFRRGPG